MPVFSLRMICAGLLFAVPVGQAKANEDLAKSEKGAQVSTDVRKAKPHINPLPRPNTESIRAEGPKTNRELPRLPHKKGTWR